MRLRSKDRRFDLRAPSVAGTADRWEFAFGDRSDSAAANGRLECFSHRTRPGAKSDRLRQSAVKRSPGIVSSPFVESPRSRRPVCSVSSALAPSTATCAIREFRAREAHAMVPLPLLAGASCQVPRPRFPAQLGASLSRSPTPSRLSAVRVRLSLTACRGGSATGQPIAVPPEYRLVPLPAGIPKARNQVRAAPGIPGLGHNDLGVAQPRRQSSFTPLDPISVSLSGRLLAARSEIRTRRALTASARASPRSRMGIARVGSWLAGFVPRSVAGPCAGLRRGTPPRGRRPSLRRRRAELMRLSTAHSGGTPRLSRPVP